MLFENLFKSENNRRKGKKAILTKDLEIHIIEIPKIYRLSKKEQKEELIKWIYFFENPENKKVWGYMKKEEEPEEIKEAREKLRAISEDEKMQRIVELRQKAIMDEKAGKEYERKEGRKEGKKEKSIEIAKKMKEKGFDVDSIQELTGLSKNEIKKNGVKLKIDLKKTELLVQRIFLNLFCFIAKKKNRGKNENKIYFCNRRSSIRIRERNNSSITSEDY